MINTEKKINSKIDILQNNDENTKNKRQLTKSKIKLLKSIFGQNKSQIYDVPMEQGYKFNFKNIKKLIKGIK